MLQKEASILKNNMKNYIFSKEQNENLSMWNVISAPLILFYVSIITLFVVLVIHFIKFPENDFPYFFVTIPIVGIIISAMLNRRYMKAVNVLEEKQIEIAEKNENLIKRIARVSIIWIIISLIVYILLCIF